MEKIKSILWVQHEDALKNGYLVVNKKFVSNPDNSIYHEINRILLKDFSLSVFDEKVVKKYVEQTQNQYFQLGSGVFKGVAYRSRFMDENGNIKPFLFWESTLNLDDFTKDAIAAAMAIEKKMDENELMFVEKYVKRIKTRWLFFGVSTLLITLFIIFVLL